MLLKFRNKECNLSLVLFWLVLFGAGFTFFLFGNTHEGLWYDESFSEAITNHSLFDIWKLSIGDSHPPLYYMLLKIFKLIFGNSIFTLRAFSAIGAIALAALGIGPIRRLFGIKTGIIYSFLCIITPIMLAYAQEARMYTWATFFVTGCGLYGYISTVEGRKKDWIFFGIFSVVAAYTHYYALLAVIIINICILVRIIITGKKAFLRIFILTSVAVILCYVPWIYSLIIQIKRVSNDFWIPHVSAKQFFDSFLFPFGLKNSIPFAAIPAAIVSFYIVIHGLRIAITERRRHWGMLILALCVFVLTISSGMLASKLIRPVYITRYMLPMLGLLILIIAYAIATVKSRVFTVFLCIFFLLLYSTQIYSTETGYYNMPMNTVEDEMLSQIGKDDIFLHTDEHTFGTFCYYFSKQQNYLYLAPGISGYNSYDAFAPTGYLVNDLNSLLCEHKSIWLVCNPNSQSFDVFSQLKDSNKIMAIEEVQYFGVRSVWDAVAVLKVTSKALQ